MYARATYGEIIMKSIRATLCILLAALLPGLSVVGSTLPTGKVNRVRTGMTIGGAVICMGIVGVTGFTLVPDGTPLADRLLVAIPSAAVAAGLGAVAGRWVADTVIKLQPSLALSPFVGAGLGAAAGAVIGGIGFALAAAIAIPAVAAPPGYWGHGLNYPQAIGMGFVAGAVWGGLAGVPIGAVTVPIISVYMGF